MCNPITDYDAYIANTSTHCAAELAEHQFALRARAYELEADGCPLVAQCYHDRAGDAHRRISAIAAAETRRRLDHIKRQRAGRARRAAARVARGER